MFESQSRLQTVLNAAHLLVSDFVFAEYHQNTIPLVRLADPPTRV